MATTWKVETKDQSLLGSLQQLLESVLKMEDVSAILVARRLPMKNMVMPTLVSDPQRLDGIDPQSPAFPMNAAKIVSRLTRKPMGGKVVAVLRPCEIRAFVELVKLKQGQTDEIVIMAIDCLGAYKNSDYFKFVGGDGEAATQRFYQSVLSGRGAAMDNVDLAEACKACEYPVATHADILIGLYGIPTDDHFIVQGLTPAGEAVLNPLGLAKTQMPPERQKTVDGLIAARTAYRDQMFARTSEATASLEKLTTYLANCVNCYNCRVACPVCYCKECVFVTDVFNHEPAQYLRWALRKGAIKMPTDTVFYHITRLAHMSTACVGCGQCSNACPNDIAVMELFRTVAAHTQKGFNYEAGRSLEEKPPLSEFRENEFNEVVGLSA